MRLQKNQNLQKKQNLNLIETQKEGLLSYYMILDIQAVVFQKNDLEMLHIHDFISDNVIKVYTTHLIKHSNSSRRFLIFDSLLTLLFEIDYSLQINHNGDTMILNLINDNSIHW